MKDGTDSDDMRDTVFLFLSNKASTKHSEVQGHGVFQEPTSMKCCPKCANDEIRRTGWRRMIEGTLATNGSLFRCIFSSHLQELDFLTENTLFPVKMTVSVASEVAKV